MNIVTGRNKDYRVRKENPGKRPIELLVFVDRSRESTELIFEVQRVLVEMAKKFRYENPNEYDIIYLNEQDSLAETFERVNERVLIFTYLGVEVSRSSETELSIEEYINKGFSNCSTLTKNSSSIISVLNLETRKKFESYIKDESLGQNTIDYYIRVLERDDWFIESGYKKGFILGPDILDLNAEFIPIS
jgi:hypothetical protein